LRVLRGSTRAGVRVDDLCSRDLARCCFAWKGTVPGVRPSRQHGFESSPPLPEEGGCVSGRGALALVLALCRYGDRCVSVLVARA
jgi:hypothetical protein